ncbi:hypothetical protein MMC07_002778 [Pseudocyphellaria aurata]|nr:hypothetical protein [Pseudocyphellaria aurata]
MTGDCTDCVPGRRIQAPTAIIVSSLPFLVTFLFVSTIVLQKIFPILSGDVTSKGRDAPASKNGHGRSSSLSIGSSGQPQIKRLSALAFSTTVALAAVLAELILCEISNTINPTTRGIAFHITVSLLLFLLIIAIPLIQIHSIVTAAGWDFTGPRQGRLRLAWVLLTAGFTAWLLAFWWSGEQLLGHRGPGGPSEHHSLSEACLGRVAVIGISFMSLLSGFASVNSPWQNFGSRPRPVTEADLARKQAGLDATHDMLAAKHSRLRALERKLLDAPPGTFFQKALGSIRGNADQAERKSLELEISGLETMARSLATTHAALQSRRIQQTRSRTATGRLLRSASYAFSVFCLYRIVTTSVTAIRRVLASPSHAVTPSDPIDHVLVFVARHYDPQLDRAAWARPISFLVSGVILGASFSSALQTFHLFARFAPALLRAVQATRALIVAQTLATYVISAALILRGMMPGQVVGDGLRGLGGRDMTSGWVDGWFERWFLGGVVVTAVGIWIGSKLGPADGEDEEWELEGGKRS